MAQIILDSNNNLIQGDFDNATLNNRTKLQTTTTNATTNVYVAPNGSATSAGVSVANNSSLTNASKIVMATNGTTDTQIISGVNGSGTYLPMSFYTNNALAAQIDTSGNFFGTAKVGGVGSVIQVVSAALQIGSNSTSSTSFVSSPLTASITPTSSSSKIFVIVNSSGLISSTLYVANYSIFRNSTNLGSAAGMTFVGVAQSMSLSMSYLDSPATTSSTSYTAYFRSNNASGTAYLGDTLGGVSPFSSITLMEIKA
jgi:hypothetical protein